MEEDELQRRIERIFTPMTEDESTRDSTGDFFAQMLRRLDWVEARMQTRASQDDIDRLRTRCDRLEERIMACENAAGIVREAPPAPADPAVELYLPTPRITPRMPPREE